MDFAVPADHRVKFKERQKKDRYLNLGMELKKTVEHEIVIGVIGSVTKGLIQGQEDLEITSRVETIQTTTLMRSARIWKNPGDLRRLAVTQTPMKDNQLMLM